MTLATHPGLHQLSAPEPRPAGENAVDHLRNALQIVATLPHALERGELPAELRDPLARIRGLLALAVAQLEERPTSALPMPRRAVSIQFPRQQLAVVVGSLMLGLYAGALLTELRGGGADLLQLELYR